MFEIGGSLRDARRHAGLELGEIASQTMIPERFLAALEQDRFDLLPPGVYRRSFLREYADFLGLRGELYTSEYDLRFAPVEPEPPLAAAPRGRFRGAWALDLLPPRLLAALAAAVLIGGAIWLLGATDSPPRAPAPLASPRISTPKPRSVAASAGQAAKPARLPPPAAAPRAAPAKTAAAAALTLRATRGDCWLEVQLGSASGRVLFERTLLTGELVRFGLRRALWIRIGAPWNLEASIGRRSVSAALPRQTATVVARAGGLSTPASTPAPSQALGASARASDENTRGYELMLAGDYRAALPLLQAAVGGLARGSGSLGFYANFNLGQTLVKLGRCSDALPYLRHAAALEPGSSEAADALSYARVC